MDVTTQGKFNVVVTNFVNKWISESVVDKYIVIVPENERMITKIKEYVDTILTPTKSVLWWYTENPLLAGISPVQMIINGRVEMLYKFVMNAKDENSPPSVGA